MTLHPYSLPKRERICRQTTLDALFRSGRSRGMVSFPLRLVAMLTDRQDQHEPSVEFMVSVPKRLFHHAVDRNRAKRQVREAYRHARHTVTEAMAQYAPDKRLHLAFLWLDSQHHTSDDIARHVGQLLQRLAERRLAPTTPQQP